MNNHRISLFFMFAVPCLLLSCGKDKNDNTGPCEPEESYIPPIVMEASKNRVNLFEMTEFSMKVGDYDRNNIFTGMYALSVYDSLVWHIDEVLDETNKNGSVLLSFGNSFNKPGTYLGHISGYKDGEEYPSNIVSVDVRVEGDFLSVKWDDPQPDGYFNSYREEYTLDLKYNADPQPHALLVYKTGMRHLDNDGWIKAHNGSRLMLHDYITELYGDCAFCYEGEDISLSDLGEEYARRFATPMDKIFKSCVAIALWDTPKAHIALVGSPSTEEFDPNYYRVIAEPRKF